MRCCVICSVNVVNSDRIRFQVLDHAVDGQHGDTCLQNILVAAFRCGCGGQDNSCDPLLQKSIEMKLFDVGILVRISQDENIIRLLEGGFNSGKNTSKEWIADVCKKHTHFPNISSPQVPSGAIWIIAKF